MRVARLALLALPVFISIAPLQAQEPNWSQIEEVGVGPMTDSEDGPKGFGAHSDQERLLEESIHKFVRFHLDIVLNLAKAR